MNARRQTFRTAVLAAWLVPAVLAAPAGAGQGAAGAEQGAPGAAQAAAGAGQGAARTAPQSSVDKDLLRQLNSRATDDVDRELFGPDGPGAKPPAPQPPRKSDATARPGAPSKPEPPPKADSPAGDLAGKLARELGRAGEKDDPLVDIPLVDIARQMQQVEALLGQAECGPRTQKLQGQIIAELEELLKETRKRCQGECNSPQGGLGGGSQPGGRPKQNPKPGPAQIAKAAAKPDPRTKAAGLTRPSPAQRAALQSLVWGNLPERERMEMEQKPPEQFLPKYELLIEEYFRRLAEEGAGGNEK